MSYIPHTETDRRTMLEAIGVASSAELFNDIPANHRFPDLDLPAPSSELEVEREVTELAARNLSAGRAPFFLGAGAYHHYIPATVDAVLQRGELFTAYTPYQPELSQGALQAIFEYQSMICALTGMEVSNASHYDGATALAEAILMCVAASRGRRPRVVLAPTLHPQYRAVAATYLHGSEAELVGSANLLGAAADVVAEIDDRTAALVVQSPNFLGQFEPVAELAAAAHDRGALLIAVPDPVALGLFRSPGEDGADVVAAEGQPLGIPLSYGGPHLGIFATRKKHLRQTAGRLVGETTDAEGRRGYVLTLATREQHIRRDKATSNICTNAALMALAAAVYLATLGRHGLRTVAELCYHKSHYAADRLARIGGLRVHPQGAERPFFKELVVELPASAAEANRHLLEEHQIIGGYDLGQEDSALDHLLLLAVTETSSRADVDRLVDGLETFAKG